MVNGGNALVGVHDGGDVERRCSCDWISQVIFQRLADALDLEAGNVCEWILATLYIGVFRDWGALGRKLDSLVCCALTVEGKQAPKLRFCRTPG